LLAVALDPNGYEGERQRARNPSPVWTKWDWAATETKGRGGHRGRKEAAHSWKRREREEERKKKREERRTPGPGKKESEERLRKQTTLHLSKKRDRKCQR
jgi:hypothetical protein